MCPGGQATQFKGSGEQQLWQQLQMSSLHMYDPWHLNATQSITHRLWRLSALGFASLPPAFPPSPVSPFARSPCHVSCLPLLSVSFSVFRLSLHFFFLLLLLLLPHAHTPSPPLFSVSLDISPLSDWRRQWVLKDSEMLLH